MTWETSDDPATEEIARQDEERAVMYEKSEREQRKKRAVQMLLDAGISAETISKLRQGI